MIVQISSESPSSQRRIIDCSLVTAFLAQLSLDLTSAVHYHKTRSHPIGFKPFCGKLQENQTAQFAFSKRDSQTPKPEVSHMVGRRVPSTVLCGCRDSF